MQRNYEVVYVIGLYGVIQNEYVLQIYQEQIPSLI